VRVARVHANRLRVRTGKGEENIRDPEARLWLDSCRVLRAILEREIDGKIDYWVRHAGRWGFVWVTEVSGRESIPDNQGERVVRDLSVTRCFDWYHCVV
jgi:hypothetical protein